MITQKLSHASAEVNMTITESDNHRPNPFERLQRWLRGESRPAVSIELEALAPLSPFHLLLNAGGIVMQVGPSLQQLLQSNPAGQSWDQLLQQWEDEEDVPEAALGPLDELRGLGLRLMLSDLPELELSGQLILLHRHQPKRWLLDLRPVLDNLDDLATAGLSLQDLSLLDPLRTGMVTRLMEEGLREELLQALREQSSGDS